LWVFGERKLVQKKTDRTSSFKGEKQKHRLIIKKGEIGKKKKTGGGGTEIGGDRTQKLGKVQPRRNGENIKKIRIVAGMGARKSRRDLSITIQEARREGAAWARLRGNLRE